jgi:Ca2+-binding RTX toxin-like protein
MAIINGTNESDRLGGTSDNDTIRGGAGSDFLDGKAGNDLLDGGSGIDNVDATADANFTLTNSRLIGDGTDTLVSIERAILTGGNSNNIIDASAFSLGYVTVYAADGNDTIYGGSDYNFLNAGAGNDVVTGGRSRDFISGSDGDDLLIGGGGNDAINSGSPQIYESGNDTLIGGSGADVFGLGGAAVYYQGAGNALITDFSIADGDKIQLQGTAAQYNLQLQNLAGNSSVQDTAIYRGSDLIGVVQDVNVIGTNSFTYYIYFPWGG